jgi:threonine dehydratase
MPATEVSFAEVQKAAERIKSIARRTPVLTSNSFDQECGVQAFFKCENLQKGGAFKIRGAANFIFSIPKEDLHKGVVAFSSGNHAQAVAIAANAVGTKATIVMPQDAPAAKMAATRAQGPRIITYDRFKEDRTAIGAKVAAETGATLVPPYDHPWIMNGQGTAALELMTEVPDLDAVIVCVGGGGFISGSAIVAKHMNPSIRVFGVEPENASDTFQSIAAGKIVTIPAPDTIADGLRSPAPGDLTFPIIQKHVEQILLVTEEEIRTTVKFLLMRMKVLAEPSGAVGAAAVLAKKLPPGIRRVGIMISGGNIDFEQLATF